MSSPGPFVSNPEYFSDDLIDALPVNGRPGPGRDVGSPRRPLNDNYYNCPPPPQPTVFSKSPALDRQTSQV